MKPNLSEIQMQQWPPKHTDVHARMRRKCPACLKADLVARHKQGIEMDYCPNCGGSWLPRGELERLMEYASRGGLGGDRPWFAGNIRLGTQRTF